MIKLFKDIKESFKIHRANKRNFKEFIQEIQAEKVNTDSTFNSYELILSPDNTKITMVISLPENYAQYPSQHLIDLKLNELAYPVTKYLIYDMNWVEYLKQPQFYHLEDEDTTGIVEGKDMSLTYLIIWEWEPVEVPDHKWKSKLVALAGAGISIIGAITSLLLIL